METMEETQKNTHHGHAVKRLRNTLGIKQNVLADAVGLSQTQISFYEQKKVIEDDMLEKFAKALNVSPELIKELEEDPVTFIIENNTFEKGSVANIAPYNSENFGNNSENFGNTYHPIEQFLELCKENQILYERLLESEKEKIKLLEKILNGKK